MTVCCCNRKVGVGKSSIAGNVAYEISKNYRVVMVDADPQGSLSIWMLNGQPTNRELSDILFESCDLKDALVKLNEGLYLLPTFLTGDLRKYAETQAGSEPYAFSDLCTRLEDQGFQFVFIDLAPGLGTFEQGAIAAMDRALLVLEPEFLSVEGLGGLLDDIENVIRKRRSSVRYDWLVANRVHAGFARHRVYLEALEKRWKDYRLFLIKQGAAVSEAQTVHEPLSVYAPKDDRALPGYRELAKEIRREYE
ncbi:MAG: ParA family protein [Candidatus Scalindua sp.]